MADYTWQRHLIAHGAYADWVDRGVVSRQAEAILNQSRGFRTLAGRAAAIQAGERQVVVTSEYGSRWRPAWLRDRAFLT
jgi:hypothetical protein